MSKPVDLIIANELHRAAEIIEPRFSTRKEAERTEIFQSIARQVLCDIAHQGRIEVVAKALEAIGVCGGVDGIKSRMQGVLEMRAEERPSLGIADPQPAPAPTADFVKAAFDNFAEKLSDQLGPGVKVEAVQVKPSEE